jgi:hypothetical protein
MVKDWLCLPRRNSARGGRWHTASYAIVAGWGMMAEKQERGQKLPVNCACVEARAAVVNALAVWCHEAWGKWNGRTVPPFAALSASEQDANRQNAVEILTVIETCQAPRS